MITISTKSNDRVQNEISLVNFTLMLFLFRTAFPYFKYLFVVLFGFSFVYFLFTYRKTLASDLIEFLRKFFIILLLTAILIISFLFSAKIYVSIFKEVINTLIIIVGFLFLYLSIKSKKHLDYFLSNLIDFVIFFGFIISLIGFTVILNIITFNDADRIDYNFALLPVLFGLGGIIYKQSSDISFSKSLLYNLVSVFLYSWILLSGSRRGMIVLVGLLTITGILYVLTFVFRSKRYILFPKRYRKAAFSQFVTFLITIFCFYIVLFQTSYRFKENALNFIGSKNEYRTKYSIAYKLNRYTSVIYGKKNDFPTLFARLWSADLYMRDPDNGWGTRIHKTISPLTGDNAGKVPREAKGYMMDSTCDANIIKNGKAISSTNFEKFRVDEGDIVEASVYCYVSNDFDGDSVILKIDRAVNGKTEANYETYKSKVYKRSKEQNLLYNGNFQDSTCGWENYYAYTTSFRITDTPFGKGINISRVTGDEDWSLSYIGRPILYHAGHEYKFIFYFRSIKGDPIPFKIGWWIDDGGQGYDQTLSLPLTLKPLTDGWFEASCSYRFKETHSLLVTFLNSLKGNSEIELADIRLYDLNSNDSLPSYVDEVNSFWQKLKVYGVCRKGKVEMSLNFSKIGVTNFKNLKGHVIFANPQINIIRREDNLRISAFGLISKNNSDQNSFPQDTSQFSELISVSKNTAGIQFLGLSELYLIKFLKILNSGEDISPDSTDKDFIRRYISRFISEDTSYQMYHADLSIDTVNDLFLGNRLNRWQFALNIFIKEFNFRQKLLGGGFTYLNWISFYFEKDKTKTDHPHNPILTILLYSGICGFIIYILLFLLTVKYYLLYFRDYGILALYFLITFFFTFFSGGGPFDPPVMGFFIILPHFINSILERPGIESESNTTKYI